MHNVSVGGVALIKAFEGFRPSPYLDGGGVWTIGYGHTQGVSAGTAPVSEAQAEAFLRSDLAQAEAEVRRLVSVTLTNNQYDALVCLIYNAGTAPLEGTLGRLLNSGDYARAANEFGRWIYVRGEICEGLARRREAEKALFCT